MKLAYRASVDNPGLRHGPVVKFTIVVHKSYDKETYAKEEEVELILPRALHNEACLLTHPVNLSIKVHA